MQVNEMVVLPTQETLEYLASTFSGCPFDIDLTKTYVSLAYSQDEMTAQPDNLYGAKAGSMDVWYDNSTGYSSLILPLISDTLIERAEELREEAAPAFYGTHYFAFIVLVNDFPPISRRYKGFINSVSDSLAMAQDARLFFDAEIQRQVDVQAVPFADYYASQIANHWGR
jgi:hypothetical protein